MKDFRYVRKTSKKSSEYNICLHKNLQLKPNKKGVHKLFMYLYTTEMWFLKNRSGTFLQMSFVNEPRAYPLLLRPEPSPQEPFLQQTPQAPGWLPGKPQITV